jgi:hypothetical protein
MAQAIRFMLGGPQARSWRQAVDEHQWALNVRRRRETTTPSARGWGFTRRAVDFDTGVPLWTRLSGPESAEE